MINLVDWRSVHSDANVNFIAFKNYDIAFVGRSLLDDRASWVYGYLKDIAHSLCPVSYDMDNYTFEFDGENFGINEYEKFHLVDKKIIIDSTALALPELVYLFLMLHDKKIPFDVLYLQPDEYKRKNSSSGTYGFDLSEDGSGAALLPKFTFQTVSSRVFVCLGFEGHRLGQILQSDDITPGTLVGLVGVPAFKPGWESSTLSTNALAINQAIKEVDFEADIATANDPYSVYRKIKKSHKAAKYSNENLLLAPFGTKPSSIACAWFAINHREDTGVIYDFVEKRKDRSSGKSLLHLWSFEYEL